MNFIYISFRNTLLLSILFCRFFTFSGYAQVQPADSNFYKRIGEMISDREFDSSETLLRNRLAEDEVTPENFFHSHLSLARMYLQQEDEVNWKREIDFCLESKLLKEFGNALAIELSQGYFTLLNYDSAFHYAQVFLAADTTTNDRAYGSIQLIVGYYYFLKNNLIQAEKSYENAFLFYQGRQMECEFPLIYSKLAMLRAKQNNFEEAHRLLDLSLAVADSCGKLEYKVITKLGLKAVLLMEGKYKEALETLEEINALDALQNKDIQAAQVREANRKLFQIEKDSNVRQSTVYFLFFLVGSLIVILVLLLYFYQKNNRANKYIMQQANQLAQQNSLIGDALNQREFLYKELNHRIKNNLQLITSMLNLQNRYSQYTSYKELITEITQKINTIALTYAKMFLDGRKTNDIVNLKDYISEIAQNALITMSQDNIELIMHATPVSTNLDIAIPLGLITNEIITNSIKHAFANQPDPTITIHLKEEKDIIYFSAEDNGSGDNGKLMLENSNSLGSKIIVLLSQQIKAQLHIESKNGMKCSFQIENQKTSQYENSNL